MARVLVIADDTPSGGAAIEALQERFEVVVRPSDAPVDATLRAAAVVLHAPARPVARLAALRSALPEVDVVVIAPAAERLPLLRAGALEALPLAPVREALVLAVERALQQFALREELRRLKGETAPEEVGGELVGRSPSMLRLLKLLDRVADAPSSVLVTGESGTGKELVARALHQRSGRRSGPFVALNCAAVPEALLESELFGHVKGAFTDARGDRSGLIAQANGGTLFLDEIGDMPPGLQAKMLRVLQERKLRPVGGEREIEVDVRVVTATHRDVDALVREGRFRGDLLFRLDVVRLELPPLRERGDDVLLLAEHFLRQHARRLGRVVERIDEGARAALVAYDWPGNVRELQNCVERAVLLCEGGVIGIDDLPARIRGAHFAATPLAAELRLEPLEAVERRHVEAVLRRVGGNKAQAARILRIDRKTLHRKIERWEAEERGVQRLPGDQGATQPP